MTVTVTVRVGARVTVRGRVRLDGQVTAEDNVEAHLARGGVGAPG